MYAQTYYAPPKVIISTMEEGILDVSGDVIEVTVVHRLNAVSTATVTLNNYSNRLGGKYNWTLHIGDKLYIALYVNDTEFPQFTGRIFECPITAFEAESFTIECQDCIGDMQYELWCPYSEEAQKTWFSYNDQAIIDSAMLLNQNDSGEGNVLYGFLQKVCGLGKNMIYIEKFPDEKDVMKNMLKETVCTKGRGDNQSFNSFSQQVFTIVYKDLFGTFDPSTSSSSTQKGKSGAAIWAGWQAKVPVNKGVWQNANTKGEYQHQCWDLYLTYANYLWHLPFNSPALHQPDDPLTIPVTVKNKYGQIEYTSSPWARGRLRPKTTERIVGGCGGYWQNVNDGGNSTISQYVNVIQHNEPAQEGDIAFWWTTPTTDNPRDPYYGYGHVAIVLQDLGDQLHVMTQDTSSNGVVTATFPKNSPNSGPWQLAGYLRPSLLGDLGGEITVGNATEAQLENTAFKLFQYFDYKDANEQLLNNNLGKYTNLYDNVPTLDFVKSICSATMRSFVSLPNGAFCAFVPDYYGFFQNASGIVNEIEINDIDLVNYSVSMSKSSYKSHVFLLTNEQFGNVYGLTSDNAIQTQIRLTDSSGIVSFQRQPDSLINFINIEAAGVPQTPKGLQQLMDRWGVSVLKQNDPNIVSHTLTTIEALKLIIDAWANVFTASVQLAYRPDLFPGLRLKLNSAGIVVFCKEVTQKWTSTTGGSTTVQTCATCSTNGKAGIF